MFSIVDSQKLYFLKNFILLLLITENKMVNFYEDIILEFYRIYLVKITKITELKICKVNIQ